MGLETLQHGTHPLAWLSIHLIGASPQFGGSRTGGEWYRNYEKHNVHRFYMVRGGKNFDAEPYFFPPLYAISATVNLLNAVYIPKWIGFIIALPMGLAIPSIRIRAPDEWADRLHRDECYPKGTACYTQHWVSPLNIGTVGTIWNSLTHRTFIRICNHPVRVLTGIFQLTLAAGMAYSQYKHNPADFLARKTAYVAGAILALI